MNSEQVDLDALISNVGEQYAALDGVEAVVIGGSQVLAISDEMSDLDVYVYLTSDVSIVEREKIVRMFSNKFKLDNHFWECGDDFIDEETQVQVDVMFRDCKWIEDKLDDVLIQCRATLGYTTIFCFNVQNSVVLFDRGSWFNDLQHRCKCDYPEALRENIISKNFPVLRNCMSSYRQQIRLAVKRGDMLSVNHRIAALLASYFDVLFAINRLPNPGEKRLLEYSESNCKLLPINFRENINELLVVHGEGLIFQVDRLLDGLEKIMPDEMSVL